MKKKISQISKVYISEISDVLENLSQDRAEIENELASGNEKLLAFIEEMHPWAFWYTTGTLSQIMQCKLKGDVVLSIR